MSMGVFPISGDFSISFFTVFGFLLNKSLTSLARLLPRFLGFVDGIISLISASISLPFGHRNATGFRVLVLCPLILLNVVANCKSFLVEFWVSFMYGMYQPHIRMLWLLPSYSDPLYSLSLFYCLNWELPALKTEWRGENEHSCNETNNSVLK